MDDDGVAVSYCETPQSVQRDALLSLNPRRWSIRTARRDEIPQTDENTNTTLTKTADIAQNIVTKRETSYNANRRSSY